MTEKDVKTIIYTAVISLSIYLLLAPFLLTIMYTERNAFRNANLQRFSNYIDLLEEVYDERN